MTWGDTIACWAMIIGFGGAFYVLCRYTWFGNVMGMIGFLIAGTVAYAAAGVLSLAWCAFCIYAFAKFVMWVLT